MPSPRPQTSAISGCPISDNAGGALAAWRIVFADPDATSEFVAVDTRRITALSTGTWRLYDFFWGHHIMEWKNHVDFKTPWLLSRAIGGRLFRLAGTALLFKHRPFRRQRHAKSAIGGLAR